MSSIVDGLPVLDPSTWRQMLAGLTDDEEHEGWLEEYRGLGASLVLMLARFYDRAKLEPVKLWERIASGIASACEQVDDGDLDRLLTLCFDHVCASHSAVAADEEFAPLILDLTTREESWKLSFVRYLRTHSYTVIIHGRAMWEARKTERKGGDH